MKKLDYSKLQPLSKNNAVNKATSAEEQNEILLGLFDYQSNFEEYIRSSNVYDSASVLLAENDWLLRRRNNSFSGHLDEGTILKVDFGKVYANETAFIHFALCIRLYGKKALVIPLTTASHKIAKAFHPEDNPSGKYSMRLAKPEEGFLAKAALYMNDAKFISYGRILDALVKIDSGAFEEIKNHLFSIAFPDREKSLKNLLKEKDKLTKENGEYINTIRNLKEELEKSKTKKTVDSSE